MKGSIPCGTGKREDKDAPSGEEELHILHGETGVEGQVDAEADDLGQVLDPLVDVPGGD